MTYDQFLILASVCMLLLFGYLIYMLANEKPSKASPRRLKNRSATSSSASGADGATASMSMAAADCASSGDGGCGGGD